MTKLTAGLASFVAASAWATSAFAGSICLPFVGCFDLPGGGSGGGSAPEIDGPGGVAAIALLVSIGAVLYRRYQR